MSNDDLLGQLRDDKGGYEEVAYNELENHNEHNNMEDDTQFTENAHPFTYEFILRMTIHCQN